MSLQENLSDVNATLTFTGSVSALAQILTALSPAGLTLATVAAVDASSSGQAPAATVKRAAKTTATTAETVRPGESNAGTAQIPAGSTPTPNSDSAAASTNSSDEAGNAQTNTGSSSEPATAGASESAAPVTYEQVSKTVLDVVAKKGRDTAVAIFQQFGVANGKELKPEQWPEALTAFETALAA